MLIRYGCHIVNRLAVRSSTLWNGSILLRQTEKQLGEKDVRLRLALAAAGLGSWEMDLVNNKRRWSSETFAMHGLDSGPDEMRLVELSDQLMHPEDRVELNKLHAELFAGRDDYMFVYRTTWPDQSVHWISARGKVIEREPRGPLRIVGVCADVTQQKQAQLAQTALDQKMRQLADALPQLVWMADASGRITYYNHKRREYLHGDATVDVVQDWQPLVHSDDLAETMSFWTRSMATFCDYEMEHRLCMADGSYRWHISRATPVVGDDGRPSAWFGTAVDIDRLKQSDAKIKAGVERLQIATEAALMFAWELNVTTGRIEWADNAAEVIGCHPSQLKSTTTDANFFMAPEDRERVLSEFETFLASGAERFEMEFRGIPDGGRDTFWRTTGKFMRHEDGTLQRAVGVTQNITRHVEAAAEVKLLSQRLSAAEEGAGALVYDWDVKKGTLWRSQSIRHILGWAPEDVPATPEAWHALKHPDDRARLVRTHNTDVDRYTLEYRVMHRDGHYRWMLDSGRAYRDANGEIIRYSGTTLDITDRKRVEVDIARVAAVAEASHDAIYGLDLEGRIDAWNPGAEKLLGYSRGEVLGQHVSLLASPEHHAEQEEFMRRARMGVSTKLYETVRRAKDGRRVDVSMTLTPAFSIDGSVTAISVALHDISERKEWEARQRMMNRELAHRVKNSFAILQAVLRSTLRTSPDPAEFAAAFSGRLHSMAAAHDVLTANDWRGAELGTLLRHQLSQFVSDSRVRLMGDVVNLPAEQVAPLSLVVNELATNALKFGALSTTRGRIDVTWNTTLEAGHTHVDLTWRELDGPPADAAGPRGFGTTLIEKSLPEATVALDYRLEGLVCNIAWSIADPRI